MQSIDETNKSMLYSEETYWCVFSKKKGSDLKLELVQELGF